jgi:hypothetical protein
MRFLPPFDGRLGLERFSLRQVAGAVAMLMIVNWSILQFALLPMVTPQQREAIYPAWMSNPYVYAIPLLFVGAAIWFVFSSRGRCSTQTRRIVAFAMAIAALGGMLMTLVIRSSWHI